MNTDDELNIGIYEFDDDLIALAKDSPVPRIKIYRPDKILVVLGRGSKPEKELNLDACRKDGIEIMRRHGGGCSVVLDPGNVIISVAFKAPGIGQNNKYFKKISDWLISGLERTGIKGIYHDGISDLVLKDKKIAGACIYRTKGLLYYSATLLFKADLELIERYLKHPPREPKYRYGRGHKDFITSLYPDFYSGSIDDFLNDLLKELGQRYYFNFT